MHDTRVAPVEALQGGITYIAQVLKRNRTLKVLNLSENKLDVAGLMAIAEALVSLHVICEAAALTPLPRNTIHVLRHLI
jgi:hypothetical protein